MPIVQNYPCHSAGIVTENEDQYLLVIVDGVGAWRFKIDVRGLVRIAAESTACLATRVRGGSAYIKTPDGSLMIEGWK